MKNQYQVESVIRKTGKEMFGEGFKMPFTFDDSKAGYGITYKYPKASECNKIWPVVLMKLQNLGLKNWYMSHPYNTEDQTFITKAKWVGIRSDHPTYNF